VVVAYCVSVQAWVGVRWKVVVQWVSTGRLVVLWLVVLVGPLVWATGVVTALEAGWSS
jgi:hypothetical protein